MPIGPDISGTRWRMPFDPNSITKRHCWIDSSQQEFAYSANPWAIYWSTLFLQYIFRAQQQA